MDESNVPPYHAIKQDKDIQDQEDYLMTKYPTSEYDMVTSMMHIYV